MAKKQVIENFDADSVWKELLEKFLKEFMEFFFLEAYEQINWEKGYEFLDKELQKVVRTAIGKRRYLDKLVKVWLKDGTETWILLHIEIQNKWEEDFSERMYIYQYRIFDKYKKKVASFVVFTDENPNWKPSSFSYQLLGSKQTWEYSVSKILDYQPKWFDLDASSNPFSLVVMAHLKLQEAKDNIMERYKWKWHLLKRLYEKGYNKEKILELFHFLDWLIVLPEDLEYKLEAELEEIERGELMPYISRIEKRWIQQGLEQGLEQGLKQGSLENARESIMDILEVRFGDIPGGILESLNKIIDLVLLKTLRRKAVQATSLEEFQQSLF